MQGIKLKLVFLYYDYLQYRCTKLGTTLFNLDKKIHSLEVKYMGIEPTVVDWSNLPEEIETNVDYTPYMKEIDPSISNQIRDIDPGAIKFIKNN